VELPRYGVVEVSLGRVAEICRCGDVEMWSCGD